MKVAAISRQNWYTTWIFLEACITVRNIQENMSLGNQLCYLVPLLVSLYQLPFERNSMGIPTAYLTCNSQTTSKGSESTLLVAFLYSPFVP